MERGLITFLCLVLIISYAYPAKITYLTGKPQIQKASQGMWQIAKDGMELSSNDKIRCDGNSRVEIRFDRGHKIKIWPNSEVVLERLNDLETKISLFIGRIRSQVKKLRKQEKYHIKTPVAVCSVRGTDFSVEVDKENKVKVEVYEGVVSAMEERTGSEVILREGQYTQIQENLAPQEPMDIKTESQQEDRGSRYDIEKIREEAHKEIFEEISKDAVLARANEEIKTAEFQNGKVSIDVYGNRVRMEEYIVRGGAKNPTLDSTQFKYVVLNTRENRFDFGKILFTFNDILPDDLTLATKTMFQSEGEEPPRWYLTDVLSVMSNTIDQVNEQAIGGRIFPDNAARPSSWKVGFQEWTFSVGTGGDIKTWWKFIDGNQNGRFDSGEISYYDIQTGKKIDFSKDFLYDETKKQYYFLNKDNQRVYFNETSKPDGTDAMHYFQKNNYSETQWIAAEDFVIDDAGNILQLNTLSNLSKDALKQKIYESNFERVYTCSIFEGRKIDLVFSAKLLIDAGMLSIPDSNK